MGTENKIVIIVPKDQKVLEILSSDVEEQLLVDEEPDSIVQVEVKYE